MINYSIVLRTLGLGGGKYQALLDSIKAQTIQPSEFLVVIPHGYELPKERLGIETFLRGNKGMVRQRVDGINAAKGDYLLIIDDDIAFPHDFVENLFSLLTHTHADMISPRVDDAAGNIGSTGLISRIMAFLSSGSYVSSKQADYAIRISALGGSIHTAKLEKDKVYYTQTGHGGCCFASREAIQQLHFEDESWLEENTTYAYPDDQVFFYKAHLQGKKTIYAHQFPFSHLDAGATLNNCSNNNEKKAIKKHDAARNTMIFWYKFQYLHTPHLSTYRFFSLLGQIWKMFFNMMLHITYSLFHVNGWLYVKAIFKGYINGLKYIKSHKV